MHSTSPETCMELDVIGSGTASSGGPAGAAAGQRCCSADDIVEPAGSWGAAAGGGSPSSADTTGTGPWDAAAGSAHHQHQPSREPSREQQQQAVRQGPSPPAAVGSWEALRALLSRVPGATSNYSNGAAPAAAWGAPAAAAARPQLLPWQLCLQQGGGLGSYGGSPAPKVRATFIEVPPTPGLPCRIHTVDVAPPAAAAAAADLAGRSTGAGGNAAAVGTASAAYGNGSTCSGGGSNGCESDGLAAGASMQVDEQQSQEEPAAAAGLHGCSRELQGLEGAATSSLRAVGALRWLSQQRKCRQDAAQPAAAAAVEAGRPGEQPRTPAAPAAARPLRQAAVLRAVQRRLQQRRPSGAAGAGSGPAWLSEALDQGDKQGVLHVLGCMLGPDFVEAALMASEQQQAACTVGGRQGQ